MSRLGWRSATDTRRPWVVFRLGFPSLCSGLVIFAFVRANGGHASFMLFLVMPLRLVIVASLATCCGTRSCVHELFAIISTKRLASYALFISASTSALVGVVGAVAVGPRSSP